MMKTLPQYDLKMVNDKLGIQFKGPYLVHSQNV